MFKICEYLSNIYIIFNNDLGELLYVCVHSDNRLCIIIYLYLMKYNFAKNILNMKCFYSSKFIKPVGSNTLLDRFLPAGLMFDAPALNAIVIDIKS